MGRIRDVFYFKERFFRFFTPILMEDVPYEAILVNVGGTRLLVDEENTIPTHQPKIKKTRVRDHDFDIIRLGVDELLKSLQTETEEDVMQRMKALVSEFTSQNSRYCKYNEITV